MIGYGKLLASFTVPGRPSPWEVMTGRKNSVRARRRVAVGLAPHAYTEWKDEVNKVAIFVMVGRRPIDVPVMIDTRFYLRPPVGLQKTPDVDNLRKGASDALQYARVITNDRLSRGGMMTMEETEGETERTEFDVYEAIRVSDPTWCSGAGLARADDRHDGRAP